MDDYTRQAHLARYEIEEDEKGYFIGKFEERQRLEFDPVSDTLSLSRMGDYIRNY